MLWTLASADDLAAAGQLAAAGAAILLTGITFAYLLATRRLAESAERQAQSAEAAAHAAQRQAEGVQSALEAQVRPELSPWPTDRTVLTSTASSIVIRIPVRNEGVGPAYVTDVLVELGDQPVTRSLRPHPVIAPNAAAEVAMGVARRDPEYETLDAALEQRRLAVHIRYRDMLGLHHHGLPLNLVYDASEERWVAEPRAARG